MNEMPKEVTLQELLKRCSDYADVIFVREEVNGRWVNKSLEELGVKRALVHVAKFIDKGIWPVRMKRQDEMGG